MLDPRASILRLVGTTDGESSHRREISREERPMCANCGCGVPEDKHGDDRNIAWSEIQAAAEANDASPTEAIQNMQRMAEQQG
jgi:hypothetical protein